MTIGRRFKVIVTAASILTLSSPVDPFHNQPNLPTFRRNNPRSLRFYRDYDGDELLDSELPMDVMFDVHFMPKQQCKSNAGITQAKHIGQTLTTKTEEVQVTKESFITKHKPTSSIISDIDLPFSAIKMQENTYFPTIMEVGIGRVSMVVALVLLSVELATGMSFSQQFSEVSLYCNLSVGN